MENYLQGEKWKFFQMKIAKKYEKKAFSTKLFLLEFTPRFIFMQGKKLNMITKIVSIKKKSFLNFNWLTLWDGEAKKCTAYKLKLFEIVMIFYT